MVVESWRLTKGIEWFIKDYRRKKERDNQINLEKQNRDIEERQKEIEETAPFQKPDPEWKENLERKWPEESDMQTDRGNDSSITHGHVRMREWGHYYWDMEIRAPEQTGQGQRGTHIHINKIKLF